MSDAVAAMGSAAVTTVGTVAVAGMAMKAVGKATGGMNRTRTAKRSTGKRGRFSRKSKSLVW